MRFFVQGKPKPKQSFKVGGSNGGYTPADVKTWQDSIGYVVGSFYRDELWTGDVAVSLSFYLPDHRRRDADNLSKAVLDALNGVIWKDDTQVQQLFIRKFYEANEELQGVMISVQLFDKHELYKGKDKEDA